MDNKNHLKKSIDYEFDLFWDYSLDKVDCFEKPFSNVFEFRKEKYGIIFLILKKATQIFTDCENETKSFMKNVLGVEIKSFGPNMLNLEDLVIEQLLNNNPILIEGNLQELYYATQYREVPWPHLFLVCGIDVNKKLIKIYDNVQLGDINAKPKKFNITVSIFKKVIRCLNNTFRMHYIDTNDMFGFYNDERILALLVEYIIHLLSEHSFRVFFFFFLDDKDYINNEKKIINTLKYYNVFFHYISILLQENNSTMNNFDVIVNDYCSSINKLVLRSLIDIRKNNLKNCAMVTKNKEIITNELKVVKSLKAFLSEFENKKEFISLHNGDVKKIDTDSAIIENDPDRVICCINNKLYFNFNTGKTYDMWFKDGSPKYILYTGDNNDFTCKIKLKILKNSVEHFQFGLFVKIEDMYYFFAIQDRRYITMDIIGIDSFTIPIEQNTLSDEYVLSFSYHKGVMKFLANKNENYQLSRFISNNNSNIIVGITCKTWGFSGDLTLLCENIDFNNTFNDNNEI